MSVIIEWDGQQVPEEFKQLPKGRYVVAPAEAPGLTDEEDIGLVRALRSVDANNIRTAEDVRQRLEAKFEYYLTT